MERELENLSQPGDFSFSQFPISKLVYYFGYPAPFKVSTTVMTCFHARMPVCVPEIVARDFRRFWHAVPPEHILDAVGEVINREMRRSPQMPSTLILPDWEHLR